MCDLGTDFASYMLNIGGLNFSRGFIPYISSAERVWYLRRSCSFGTDLVVLSLDLSKRIGFVAAVALATSFTRKSLSPWLRLSLGFDKGPHWY